MDDRRGLQQLSWYAKSGYLGDKAIMHVAQKNTSEMGNFLRLPIEIQKMIILKKQPKIYDGWKLDNEGDNISIYIDKSMYYVDPRHYHDQVEKINLVCFRWPTSFPGLILDFSFNNWIFNIAHHTPQELMHFFDWINQIAGDLNYHKMIYDFTTSFISKSRQSKKLIQKINYRFARIKSGFSVWSSRERSVQKVPYKAIQTCLPGFHIDTFNPHFIERYPDDKYVKLLKINPCKVLSQVFLLPKEIQEIIAVLLQ